MGERGPVGAWLRAQVKYNRLVMLGAATMLASWGVSNLPGEASPLLSLLGLAGLSLSLAIGPRWALAELDLRDERRSGTVAQANLAESLKSPRELEGLPGRARTRSLVAIFVVGLFVPVFVIAWWMAPVFSMLDSLPAGGGGVDVVGPELTQFLPLAAAWLFALVSTTVRAIVIKRRLHELLDR